MRPAHAIAVALLALVAGHEPIVASPMPPTARLQRRVVLVGGPTLAQWRKLSPSLFGASDVRVILAADGKAASMRATAQSVIANPGYEVVQILPESGFGGESLHDTEQDLAALTEQARGRGAHVVLATPLHLGAGAAPVQDDALNNWMRAEALRTGALFADYRHVAFGPQVPLATAAGLVSRTVLIRSALDDAFRAQPGISTEDRQRRTALSMAAQPDTVGTGPYPALRMIDPALPTHTFYRPANLAPFVASKLPVLIFGNGGCSDDSGLSRQFLEEIASHGYLVLDAGFMKTGPGGFATPAQRGKAPAGAPLPTSFQDLLAALDWVTQPSAANHGWLPFMDPSRIAVAGWSCGGLQALQLALDKRVATAVILDSGTFDQGAAVPGMDLAKADLQRLHGPLLYVLGGTTDVAFGNGADDFSRIGKTPAMLISRDVGHGGTFQEPHGGAYAQVTVDWLDWQLKHVATAPAMFIGGDCGLCQDPNWTVKANTPMMATQK